MIFFKQKTLMFFTLAQLGIILMFSVVTAFSLMRLFDVGDIVVLLTEKSLPSITQRSSLNADIQSLATITTLLTDARSSPERHVAKRKIDEVVNKINLKLTNIRERKLYLSKQLNTIYAEIAELDSLIDEKLVQQLALNKSFEEFNNLIRMLFVEGRHNNNTIEDNLLEILLLTIRIDRQTRLHKIRSIENQLNNKIDQTEKLILKDNVRWLKYIASLRILAVGEKGLVSRKVESLKLIGRTRGRDSFVRNLISNVASNLQYQTHIVNQNAITQASNAANEVSKQTSFTIWVGGFSIIVALGLIYILYRRFVLRLLLLAAKVERAANDNSAVVAISGHDEIAGLSKTFSIYLKRVRDQEKALLDMTLTDPLTNIPNRRAFESQIINAIAQSRRNEWSLTVLLIDIDYFKPYNDHYGHTDGDACLRLVANQLNSVVLRNTDFCARFGGEEFICLLPNTDANGAKKKANDLRKAIESMQIPHIVSDLGKVVTVSVGAATFSFNAANKWSAEIIIEQADKALYQAKADGRNCCSYFAVS